MLLTFSAGCGRLHFDQATQVDASIMTVDGAFSDAARALKDAGVDSGGELVPDAASSDGGGAALRDGSAPDAGMLLGHNAPCTTDNQCCCGYTCITDRSGKNATCG